MNDKTTKRVAGAPPMTVEYLVDGKDTAAHLDEGRTITLGAAMGFRYQVGRTRDGVRLNGRVLLPEEARALGQLLCEAAAG